MSISDDSDSNNNRSNNENRLAAGPGWELPSHEDLVPPRSRSHAKPGPGAPIPQRFGPIPSHEKKFDLISSWSCPGPIPGWDESSWSRVKHASTLQYSHQY